MDDIRVTMRHARAAQLAGVGVLCAPGIRPWFARHRLDYRAFLRDGLPVGELEKVQDAFAQRAAAIAREEAARGQEQ